MREYWDACLKNQSKGRVKAFHSALKLFDGKIHDWHEDKHFSGKQSWRNPISLRISLPEGQRFPFILHTIRKGYQIWLSKPPRITAGIPNPKPRLKLKGNHDVSKLSLRRGYYLHSNDRRKPYLADLLNGEKRIFGQEVLERVLDGELDLLN